MGIHILIRHHLYTESVNRNPSILMCECKRWNIPADTQHNNITILLPQNHFATWFWCEMMSLLCHVYLGTSCSVTDLDLSISLDSHNLLISLPNLILWNLFLLVESLAWSCILSRWRGNEVSSPLSPPLSHSLTHLSLTLTLILTHCQTHSRYTHSLVHIDGLVQERRNSSASAMELYLSCTNPSICLTTTVPHMSLPGNLDKASYCHSWSPSRSLWDPLR